MSATNSFPSNAQVIREWLDVCDGKPPNVTDAFFRFIALWIAFNAYYGSAFDRHGSEWSQIEAFTNDHRTLERYVIGLAESESFVAAVVALAERGIDDGWSGKHFDVDPDCSALSVMRCIYAVRSNLFHGDKVVTNARDATVVGAATIILRYLMDAHV